MFTLLFAAKTAQSSRYGLHTGSVLTKDPISPLSWEVGRQTCCCAPQTVPEPSVLHGKTHYPADGSHSHQGILFPSRPILNTIFCLLSIRTRTLCQQSELQQLRFGPQSQPSLPTCINEPWPPMTLSLVLSVVSFDHF